MFRLTALLCSSVLLAACLVACGDDDQPAGDGGSSSGGRDAGAHDSGEPSSAHDAGAVVAIDDEGAPVPTCPSGECDLTDADACGPARGCVLPHGDIDASAGPQCAAVGDGADGDACERSSDCGAGLDCSAFDGTGVCRHYCCNLSRTEGCPNAEFCALGLGTKAEPSGAALCLPCAGCDPDKTDACEQGFACYPLPGSQSCTACLPAGTRKPGAECTLSTQCTAGTACFRFADKSSRCVEFCNIEKEGECLAPKKCTSVASKLPHDIALCL
jgi:hypothetical protein